MSPAQPPRLTLPVGSASQYAAAGTSPHGAEPARVTILFATDPICSHCWAMEPAWRRFLYHFGELIEVRHVYGGLLPSWNGFRDLGAGIASPADVAPHWDEVVARYRQPIDSSVWLRDPLHSSYPPTLAALAVRSLAPALEDRYLRRLREALFLEGRNIARPSELRGYAVEIGVDGDAFHEAFESIEIQRSFREDRAQLRTLGIAGFPTLVVDAPEAERAWVLRGTQPYHRLERALQAVLGELPPQRPMTPASVLAAYGSGTTREFAEVLEQPEAEVELLLAAAGGVREPIAGSARWHEPRERAW